VPEERPLLSQGRRRRSESAGQYLSNGLIFAQKNK
jgi:hypothetical protein